MTKTSLFSVSADSIFEVISLHLEEHDAICDHMEEVVGHTDLAVLEDLLVRTHENTMGLYNEFDLDYVRRTIPDSRLLVAKMTEDEALELAWDIIQAVKQMREKAIKRLSLVK